MQKLFGSTQKRPKIENDPEIEEKAFQEYVFYALQKAKELDHYIQATSLDFKMDIENHITRLMDIRASDQKQDKNLLDDIQSALRSLKERIEVYEKVYSDPNNFLQLSEETKELIAELKLSREKSMVYSNEHEALINNLKRQLKAEDGAQQCYDLNKKLVEENNYLKQKVEQQTQEIRSLKEEATKKEGTNKARMEKLEAKLEHSSQELRAVKEYFKDLGFSESFKNRYTIGVLEQDFFKLLKERKIKQLILEYCGTDELMNLLCLNKRIKTHILNTNGIIRIIGTKFLSQRYQMFKLADTAKIVDIKGQLSTLYDNDKRLLSYVRRFLIHNYDATEYITDKIKGELKQFDEQILNFKSVKDVTYTPNPSEPHVKDLVYNKFRNVFSKFDKHKKNDHENPNLDHENQQDDKPIDRIIGDMYDNIMLYNFREIQVLNKNLAEEILTRRLALVLYQNDVNNTESETFKTNQNAMYLKSISEKPRKYIELHDQLITSMRKAGRLDEIADMAQLLGQKLCKLLYMMKIVFAESDLLQKVKHLLYSEILLLDQQLNMKEVECDSLRNQLNSLTDDIERVKVIENTKNVFYQDNKKLKVNMLNLNEVVVVY